MITKITFSMSAQAISYSSDGVFGGTAFGRAAKYIREAEQHLQKAASLCDHAQNNREMPVPDLIKQIYGPAMEPYITHKTKTKRTYTVPYLFIHEEDK